MADLNYGAGKLPVVQSATGEAPDLTLEQQSSGTIPAGKAGIYALSDGELYFKDAADNEVKLTDGGSPAAAGGAVVGLPPVGSIIAFYDFDGAVSKGAEWLFCDGSVIDDAASPLDTETLPDLSNRYMVGFGTEAGGDIDSAAWATAAVGNASHQADLEHLHSTNITSFTSGAGTAHSHGAGSLRFPWLEHTNILKSTGTINTFNSSGGDVTTYIRRNNESATSASNGQKYMIDSFGDWKAWTEKDAGMGSTDNESAHTHSVNPPATNSGNSLSTTEDIQPRSVRVRFVMRVK